MTISDLLEVLGRARIYLAGWFVFLPVLAFAYGLLHQKGAGGLSPHRYVYSVFCHLAAAPGAFAVVLLGYALFFLHQNLLQVDLVLYFLPIISMGAVFAVVRRSVDLEVLPGIDRLLGLFCVMGLAMGGAFAVSRTRIWILFGGSIFFLLILAVVFYLVFKWALAKLMR